MAEAEKKKKQQGGHLAKRPAATTQHGHYADPLSPIASTPLKRQRINSAESSKASSSNHRAQGETRGTPAKSKQGGKFLSPRKLVKDFDANDGQSPNASTPNGTNAKSGEETPSASDDENANAEMFSPALKPPRSSRSPSSSPARSRTVVEATVVSSSSSSSEKSEASTTVSTTVEEEIVSEEATDEPAEQEFNPFYFMKTLPKYEDVAHGARPVALPERSRSSPKICLVLDLDETLVHCSVDDVDKPHLQFPVNFNGVDYTVNVKKRPHMEYFLRRVSKLFEVVVFTASHKAYAEKLLNLLDPHRNLIKYRLFREDCLDVYGNYLKDLNVLGRDLSKVLLVDNSPHAFGYQVSNGIPIETWYDDESDDELLNLLPFLESLVDADDVRPVIEKQFQIQKLIDATPDEIL